MAGLGKRSRIVLLVLWIGLVLPARAQTFALSDASPHETSEIDLQSYRQELSRLAEESKNEKGLRELRKSLPNSWEVKTGDRLYSVSTKEISDALFEMERNPKRAAAVSEQLQARLRSMQQGAAEAELPSLDPNPAEADHKLESILNRSEFKDAAGPSFWDQVTARINRWIVEHIIRLLSRLHISQKTGNYFAWAVIFVAVVGLFYVVYGRLLKSARTVRFRAEAEPVASDARQWLQEALSSAEQGDFREAIHCAYWASVARLEDIRVLPKDRSRTPRESLRLLDHHPREQGVLQNITRSFELVWYGYRPASAADWAGAKEQLEKMGCLQASIASTALS